KSSTYEAPADLLNNPEISKALSVVEQSAYTPEQLLGYEKFWDIISTEKTYYGSALKRGLEQGRAQGLEQGRAQGLEEGRAEGRAEGLEQGLEQGRAEGIKETARKLKMMGLSAVDIQKATGLSEEEISGL
ncbi:MAG: hypothetical protein SPE09_03305, partial [Alloprevotella sp.]|nr:hypothetical protein [Alloprevotella sp.]